MLFRKRETLSGQSDWTVSKGRGLISRNVNFFFKKVGVILRQLAQNIKKALLKYFLNDRPQSTDGQGQFCVFCFAICPFS